MWRSSKSVMVMVAVMVMAMVMVTNQNYKTEAAIERQARNQTFIGRARARRPDADKSLRGIGLTRGFPARDWVLADV